MEAVHIRQGGYHVITQTGGLGTSHYRHQVVHGCRLSHHFDSHFDHLQVLPKESYPVSSVINVCFVGSPLRLHKYLIPLQLLVINSISMDTLWLNYYCGGCHMMIV